MNQTPVNQVEFGLMMAVAATIKALAETHTAIQEPLKKEFREGRSFLERLGYLDAAELVGMFLAALNDPNHPSAAILNFSRPDRDPK